MTAVGELSGLWCSGVQDGIRLGRNVWDQSGAVAVPAKSIFVPASPEFGGLRATRFGIDDDDDVTANLVATADTIGFRHTFGAFIGLDHADEGPVPAMPLIEQGILYVYCQGLADEQYQIDASIVREGFIASLTCRSALSAIRHNNPSAPPPCSTGYDSAAASSTSQQPWNDPRSAWSRGPRTAGGRWSLRLNGQAGHAAVPSVAARV